MRAFQLDVLGAMPALVDLPTPEATTPDQAVATVLAAGLNPADEGMARVELGIVLPRVLGTEAVVELDGGIYYVEQAVRPHGTYAERCLVDRRDLVPVPAGLEPAQVIPLGVAGLAGWIPIAQTAALKQGETVLVLGASSTAGQVAVQAARLLGAGRIIAAGRNVERLERLRARGADEIVVLGRSDDRPAIAAACEGGADLIWDCLFGKPLEDALAVSPAPVRSVSIGNMAGDTIQLSIAPLLGKQVLTYGNGSTPFAAKRDALVAMMGYVLAGQLVVEYETVRLADIAPAWTRQLQRQGGKIVVIP